MRNVRMFALCFVLIMAVSNFLKQQPQLPSIPETPLKIKIDPQPYESSTFPKQLSRMRYVRIAWIHNMLSNRFGLDLAPLETKPYLPSIAVMQEQAIRLRCYNSFVAYAKIEALFRGFPSGLSYIYIAREHIAPEQIILVHELTHFVLFRYGQHLQIWPRWDERIAQAMEWNFTQNFGESEGVTDSAEKN